VLGLGLRRSGLTATLIGMTLFTGKLFGCRYDQILERPYRAVDGTTEHRVWTRLGAGLVDGTSQRLTAVPARQRYQRRRHPATMPQPGRGGKRKRPPGASAFYFTTWVLAR
jgi:hypothetical protein